MNESIKTFIVSVSTLEFVYEIRQTQFMFTSVWLLYTFKLTLLLISSTSLTEDFKLMTDRTYAFDLTFVQICFIHI